MQLLPSIIPYFVTIIFHEQSVRRKVFEKYCPSKISTHTVASYNLQNILNGIMQTIM